MALQKEETACGCGCGYVNNATDVTKPENEGAAVIVLGTGCKKCNQLEENTIAALAQLGMDTTVDHVADFAQIASYGVMTTPALVVNGKVVANGKVPKIEEIVALLDCTT